MSSPESDDAYYIDGIEALVCDDIAKRQRIGKAKYGVSVADNPASLKEWLQHAYEECLDKAIYLRRAIEDMTNPQWQKAADQKPKIGELVLVRFFWDGLITLARWDGEIWFTVSNRTYHEGTVDVWLSIPSLGCPDVVMEETR